MYTPETLKAYAFGLTYGKPDGPKLREALCQYADAWQARETELVEALKLAKSGLDDYWSDTFPDIVAKIDAAIKGHE